MQSFCSGHNYMHIHSVKSLDNISVMLISSSACILHGWHLSRSSKLLFNHRNVCQFHFLHAIHMTDNNMICPKHHRAMNDRFRQLSKPRPRQQAKDRKLSDSSTNGMLILWMRKYTPYYIRLC